MAQSVLLPAVVIVIALVAALCFATPRHMRRETTPPSEQEAVTAAHG
jgi:hypothetical protein